ncbi:MAG TPA: hypothetical protein PLD55_14175 [bacterium]|jgi:hypothetical protein|nr:hypothetical protein [bacterium]HNZ53000.1 hypothetical protein [bacterium]HOG42829.1 hypothetical protein [bacterium]HPY13954.1 hypothetical protein [bacterium]HQB09053.1 hypothetical protein [bacterium]
MKNLFICLILVSFFFGCGESSEQENGDADTSEESLNDNEEEDSENIYDEMPDITSAIVFMDNFKAENGGYGHMFHEGNLIGTSFNLWNGENNSDTCKNEFLSPEPHHSYMHVEGLMQLRILINGYKKGEYKIVKYAESDFFSKDEKLATIRACVWHKEELQPGFEDCYVPYTGKVTVDRDVPPTVKDSKGVKVILKVDAEFPEESIRLIDREGYGEEVGDEYIEYEVCNCRHDDGSTSQCEPSYNGENCCYNPNSKMVNYKLNLNADVCHLYCSVTTESVSDMEKCQP